MSRPWAYIKKHKRQDPNRRRDILPDDKLRAVFGGQDRMTMFEVAKHLSRHLS